MVEIGRINNLQVVKKLNFGIYLDGGTDGEILMPVRYVPASCNPGDMIDAFIYFDSEDRIIATTERPYAMVGEFAYLRAVSVNNIGAFMDWGLSKDLLVPFREQKQKMAENKFYLVRIYFDKESHRIAASAKLENFLDNLPPVYKEGEEVNLIIEKETDLGFKAIINHLHWGMLYKTEVFQALDKGAKLKGYIKKIREDEKIDLSLLPSGYVKIDPISQKILEYIKEQKGFIPVSDKSSPEIIYSLFQISKKSYKQAIGSLYKKGLIIIEDKGVRIAVQ